MTHYFYNPNTGKTERAEDPEELTRENIYEDGSPIESHQTNLQVPMWRKPVDQFEIDFLNAVGLKLFPNDKFKRRYDIDGNERESRIMSGRDIRNRVAFFRKSIQPASVTNMPRLPKEFVYAMIDWAKRARLEGKPITASKLISAIEKPDNLSGWIDSYLREQEQLKKEKQASEPVYTSNVDFIHKKPEEPKEEEPKKHDVEKTNPYPYL